MAATPAHIGLPHVPSPRVHLVIFAIGWTAAAGAFLSLVHKEAPPFGWVWPVLFGATAVACWGFFLVPWCRRWYALSGALSFVSVLARSAGVILNLVKHAGPAGLDPGYAVLGLVIYPLFASALLYVWHVGFYRLLREHQSEHRGSDRGGTGAASPGS